MGWTVKCLNWVLNCNYTFRWIRSSELCEWFLVHDFSVMTIQFYYVKFGYLFVKFESYGHVNRLTIWQGCLFHFHLLDWMTNAKIFKMCIFSSKKMTLTMMWSFGIFTSLLYVCVEWSVIHVGECGFPSLGKYAD